LGGARVMGRAAELGTLEPGKLADLLVLEADPLADIRNLRRIHSVVKGGRVFDPDAILGKR
ncbi:MAG: amidohydrolase family protein, partial [Gammaproteobacteria bacterium]